jgi:hypothetical protein
MGHRANFVVIEEGAALAYYDNWAGLGAAFAIADGPGPARDALKAYEPADELLDWAFAEGGFLLDFDQKLVIVFGELDDMADEFSDFDEDEDEEEDVRDDEGDDDFDDDADVDGGAEEADGDGGADTCTERYTNYFQEISPLWQGWRLRYDDRGVDAFAEYLMSRGISSIQTQQPSHPESTEQVEFQA